MNAGLARLVARRIGTTLCSLVFVVVAIFFMTAALPGDVADMLLGQNATPAAAQALRHSLHLDQPLWLRFVHWCAGMLHGDPGTSLLTGRPVGEMLAPRLYNSLLLAGATTMVSVPLALLLGLACATWRDTYFDRVMTVLTLGIVSVPAFLIATVAVFVFAVQFRIVPALSDIRSIHSVGQFFLTFTMPVSTLASITMAQMIRMIRACMIDVFSAPYIEMAVLKGVPPIRIVLYHALPNAIGPVANAIALSLSSLLGGVVVIETIFNYPGLAQLMVDSVMLRDVPIIQSCALLFCLTYLFLTTLADIVALASVPKGRGA
ncbi:ABC transporter permease [Komagataeibacter xylinus]|uniref:ABC transporter permease n=1 Tax=Komagataeibacter xylinus TaxID=28448 RepID=A0A857FRP0_KOMXY|nr:ABC transporter permease [Komagataeibacter xylinus]QHC36806.1 ABC transporter permease [Komagataeibacter xylinus]